MRSHARLGTSAARCAPSGLRMRGPDTSLLKQHQVLSVPAARVRVSHRAALTPGKPPVYYSPAHTAWAAQKKKRLAAGGTLHNMAPTPDPNRKTGIYTDSISCRQARQPGAA